jgi:hypothetical protein
MFDKQTDKAIRQPVTEDNSNGGKQVRLGLDSKMIMDSEFYEKIHHDKKLMKINDLNDDIDWWLQRGAEPVPRADEQRKVFKGLNDKGDSEWVCWPGGTHDGTPFKVYLLMIDPELYEKYKLVPEKQRRDDIRAAMKMGVGTETDAKTYAPNLPGGAEGTGFNSIRQHSTQATEN